MDHSNENRLQHFSIIVAILWQPLATDLKYYTLRSFPADYLFSRQFFFLLAVEYIR